MTDDPSHIYDLPIASIAILNPRVRNKRIFSELVRSIATLGLKKPIIVRSRPDRSGFDLVCGQGRLEAYTQLGQTTIPSLVVEATLNDCLVMSLVENLARRQHSPLELVREIGSLKERGYSPAEIARKTDFSLEYVSAICLLFEHGEERLLAAMERGIIPPGIAIAIMRAKDGEVQRALAEAYETRSLPGKQIVAIRRIIEARNSLGRLLHSGPSGKAREVRVTASALIKAYQNQTQRQRALVRQSELAQSRLHVILTTMKALVKDEHFMTLLRAENLQTMPKQLVDRLFAPEE
jgi:ParB family transcriptional regulator, chromosome partitioning protein